MSPVSPVFHTVVTVIISTSRDGYLSLDKRKKLYATQLNPHTKSQPTVTYIRMTIFNFTIQKPNHLQTDLLLAHLKTGYVRYSIPHCNW